MFVLLCLEHRDDNLSDPSPDCSGAKRSGARRHYRVLRRADYLDRQNRRRILANTRAGIVAADELLERIAP
jgi:hypothetical protein